MVEVSKSPRPNPRLQRTRAALPLQTAHGETSPLGGARRAPLSRKPLGRRSVIVVFLACLLCVTGSLPALSMEELVYVTLKAPRSLAGAHVWLGENDLGKLTFRQETGPNQVSMELVLPDLGDSHVRIVKPGYKAIHLVISPRAYRFSVRVRPHQVKQDAAA